MDAPVQTLGFTTYLESWQKNKNIDVVKQMAAEGLINKNTKINIAFASYHWDENQPAVIPGLEMNEDTMQKIIEIVHSQGGKVGLTLGGANKVYSLQNSQHFNKPETIATCLNATIKKYKFDVIDFDVEDQPGEVLKEFVNRQSSVINKLRRLNPHVHISLTLMGQCLKNDGSYPLTLLNQTYGNINSVAIMEYNIWAASHDQFEAQIMKDMNLLLDQVFTKPDKLVLGLMPGKDDWQKNNLTLKSAENLTQWAVNNKLRGIMTWDANRDCVGVDNNASFAYAKTIQNPAKIKTNARVGQSNTRDLMQKALLEGSALSQLGISQQQREGLGYKFVKLKKSESKLPFSLIASKAQKNGYDIFVHVHSQKEGSYPGLLGKGWFADTEIAQNLRTKEWVAAKCYKRKEKNKVITPELLKNEIEILKIQDLYRGFATYWGKDGTQKTNVYMKYVTGKDIQQVNLPSTLKGRIDCAISAIKCLKNLHSKNWIHADIHPGNLMLDPENRKMELIDFNKAAQLNHKNEAYVIQGGLKIAIPGNVHDALKDGKMVMNKHTDQFALGETLAFMFNEKKHPVKNHAGYFNTLLCDQSNLKNRLCSEQHWKELNQILLSLTQPGEADLENVVKRLESLKAKL